jgi:hypothetical protein
MIVGSHTTLVFFDRCRRHNNLHTHHHSFNTTPDTSSNPTKYKKKSPLPSLSLSSLITLAFRCDWLIRLHRRALHVAQNNVAKWDESHNSQSVTPTMSAVGLTVDGNMHTHTHTHTHNSTIYTCTRTHTHASLN